MARTTPGADHVIDIENGVYEREGFGLRMSFNIAKGALVSIVGPSGAGKSTLLNIIAGFEALQSGKLLLNGEDTTTMAPAMRPVSFIFQDNNSFAHLTARDNVGLGIAPSLRLTSQQWQQVDQALKRVGLVALASKKPGDMSGGERQRIALARVLVRQKPIVLLDEPLAALGPALRKDMMQLLLELQTELNLTILMVTHQPEDAQRLGGDVMFVDKGQVRAPVAAAQFFDKPDAGVRNYLGA